MDDEKVYALYESRLSQYKAVLQDFITENEFSLSKSAQKEEFKVARKELASLASGQYMSLRSAEFEKRILGVAWEIHRTTKHLKPDAAGNLEEVIDRLNVNLSDHESLEMIKYVSSFRRLTKEQKKSLEEYRYTLRSYIKEYRDELESKSEIELKSLWQLSDPSQLEREGVPIYLLSAAHRVRDFIGDVEGAENPRWTRRVDKVVAEFSSKVPIHRIKELCSYLSNEGNASL